MAGATMEGRGTPTDPKTLEDPVVASLDRHDLANLAALLALAAVVWLAAVAAAPSLRAGMPRLELPALEAPGETPTPSPAAGGGLAGELRDGMVRGRVGGAILGRVGHNATRLPRAGFEPYPDLVAALDPVCAEPPEPEGACPEWMAFVPSCGGFCIDRYEAARTGDGREVSLPGALPWTSVTWHGARAACEAAGKRLCKDHEWMAACDLGGMRYGLTDEEGDEAFGCNTHCEGGCNVSAAGTRPRCHSRSGVYDMVGNAYEWTDAVVPDGSWAGGDGYVGDVLGRSRALYGDDYLYRPEANATGKAFMRGGPMASLRENSPDAGCFFLDVQSAPEESYSNVGFRCCADAG